MQQMGKMEYKEYQKLASRTMSPHGDQLTHCVIGMVTELGEFIEHDDQVNAVEELGDIWWYTANLDFLLGSEFRNQAQKYPRLSRVTSMFYSLGQMFDVIKRRDYYKDIFDYKRFVPNFEMFQMNLINLSLEHTSLENIWRKNIKKLYSRYGEKFSEDKALMRDLGIEREILENG